MLGAAVAGFRAVDEYPVTVCASLWIMSNTLVK
jgi:hypothetical protein